MPLSLAQAAQQVGLHRSNLLRAIKAGRVSAQRDDSGAWQVDESELVRVYGDLRSATLQPAQPDALIELRLQQAEQRVSDLTRQLERALCEAADWKREASDWKEEAKRIALPAPSAPHQVTQPSQRRSFWRWLRTTD
jgi:predicted site-specific integrase-resolvase